MMLMFFVIIKTNYFYLKFFGMPSISSLNKFPKQIFVGMKVIHTNFTGKIVKPLAMNKCRIFAL